METKIQTEEFELHRLNSDLKSLYDRYRTAYYNALYYGEKLVAERKKNRLIEIVVAFSTPGAIGSVAIWGTTEHYAVILLGIGASVLAAIKPILNVGDNIQRYTRLFTSYKEIAAELKLIVEEVRSDQDFTPETRLRFATQAKKIGDLDTLDDPQMDRIREKRCYEKVNKMFPPNYFWHPSKEKLSK